MGPEYLVIALGLGILASSWLFRRATGGPAARLAEEAASVRAALEARLQPSGSPLTLSVRADADSGTRLVIAGVCDRLTLRKEDRPTRRLYPSLGQGRQPPTLLAGREVETGDDEFDRAFFVLGPPAVVLGILDAETRRRLCKLFAHEGPGTVVVASGELSIKVWPWASSLEAAVEKCAHAALAVAQRLVTPTDVAARLAYNARHDKDAMVRMAALAALVHDQPDHVAARAALRTAASDKDPEVRLQAAIELGEEGDAVLYALALSEHVVDACAAHAIDALGARIDPHRAIAILDRALRRPAPRPTDEATIVVPAGVAGPELARACIDALARSGSVDAVPTLRHVMLTQDALAVGAAAALAALDRPEAEATLVAGLRAEAWVARVAAAEHLGTIGTSAAVLPLMEAAEHGVGDLRRAARRSVAAIQARLTGAPGEVSLAGGETGDEAGDVSLLEDAAGRVSLPAGAKDPGTA